MATGLVAGAGVEVHVGQGATSWDESLDGEMDHLPKLVEMQIQQLRPSCVQHQVWYAYHVH
jgi:hypothetical protein